MKHHTEPARRLLADLERSMFALPGIIERATVFHARVGTRPAFATSHEAVQFERGYNDYPNQPPGLPYGPRIDGYFAAELAHADALAAMVEHRDFEVTQ